MKGEDVLLALIFCLSSDELRAVCKAVEVPLTSRMEYLHIPLTNKLKPMILDYSTNEGKPKKKAAVDMPAKTKVRKEKVSLSF